MPESNISLAGQAALITGGGRGIGRAIAQTLAGAGASVAVVARSQDEIAETVRLIEQEPDRGQPPKALAIAADVTDSTAVHEVVQQIERELGPVDILVNNAAAVKPFGPFWETDVEDWWRTMEINLRGVALCTRAVLPGMVARRHGRIVNVSSGAGVVATPFYSSYIVSKTALIRFTECLAMEAGPQGVFSFAIHPGTVRTTMSEYSLYSEEGRKWLPWFSRIFEEKMDVTADRPAKLVLDLVSGEYDALSGKMISIYEDLGQLKQSAAEIQERNLFTLTMGRLNAAPVNPRLAALLSTARDTAKKNT